MAFEFNFFENIETSLIGNVDMFFGKCMSLVTYITPLVTTGLGIYIILQAYHYYKMGLDESILDISRRMVGWILIAMLALNAGNYEKMAKMVYKFPDEIASAFNGTEIKGNALDTSRKTSDEVMKAIYEKGDKEYDNWFGISAKFTVFAINWLISKAIIACFLCIIFAFYLVAKVSLLITLMVGPLFVGCLFFPATRHYGMNWINQIFSYTVTILMYMVLISIQQNFFDSWVLALLDNMNNGHPIGLVSGIIAFNMVGLPSLIVFFIVMLKIPQMAAALTGGNPQMSFGSIVRTIASVKSLGFLGKGGAVTNGGK